MPGFDGTGPFGRGPRFGRGLGPCGRGRMRGFGFFRNNSKEFLQNRLKDVEEEKKEILEELDRIK
ncbi:MAG: hypothetical protein AMS24_04110 [Chlamydiae bacterium SM23_39]|nr:MAG: hypothetical protein AMS24_04110 [Chlamydiae bacterium SM23_39]